MVTVPLNVPGAIPTVLTEIEACPGVCEPVWLTCSQFAELATRKPIAREVHVTCTVWADELLAPGTAEKARDDAETAICGAARTLSVTDTLCCPRPAARFTK